MKKLFATFTLALTIFLAGQIIYANNVSAKDVWIYSGNDGTSYWVDSNTAFREDIGGGTYRGVLKTVRNGQLLDSTTWEFYEDEGYIFAGHPENRSSSIVIYADPYAHYGEATVYDRPELLAMYHWLLRYLN